MAILDSIHKRGHTTAVFAVRVITAPANRSKSIYQQKKCVNDKFRYGYNAPSDTSYPSNVFYSKHNPPPFPTPTQVPTYLSPIVVATC